MPRVRVGDRTVSCEAIVLDKDGTITNFQVFWLAMNLERMDLLQRRFDLAAEVRQSLIRSLGLDPAGGGIHSRGPVALAPRRFNMAVFATVLYQHGMHWDVAWAAVNEAFAAADRSLDMARCLVPLPGVVEHLHRLHAAGFRLALATSDSRGTTEAALGMLEIRHLFEVLVTGDQVTHPKPHPEMLDQVAAGLGLRPGQLIMAGDGVNDVQLGRNGGAALSVGVLTGLAGRDELEPDADVVVASITDLMPV